MGIMAAEILTFDQVMDRLISSHRPWFANYLAMYSSWYGGIIVDPALMMVPVDDHLVHRGDGVFETFKCTNWNIYLLDRHLDRLETSAAALEINIPADRPRLVEIIRDSVRAGNSGTCVVRIFVSRGPGGFSADPYESAASQLYVMAIAFQPLPPESYEKGVTLATSAIPAKTDFATIKSCNYLLNVLMKKEAVDAGVDYPVSIDENGFLAEGATENVGIITREGEFLIPRFRRILRGITVTRATELARSLLGREIISVAEADITREQACGAAEMVVLGTSINILPVVEYDGKKIGDGRPGPVYRKLFELFKLDEGGNTEVLTPV
jgi:branched-subunit amino acid aminotransferase/4-amino-4-deoxychorismate lyase